MWYTREVNNDEKPYDLEERTFLFAKEIRVFVASLQKTSAHIEDGKQLIRSSGSVAANYIEANESLSKKDFVMRMKICRKEAKESVLWLRLLSAHSEEIEKKRRWLTEEAVELKKIFSRIVEKST